ncbi:50S ribosomal protein L27 [Candidatus Wirthbacteria bacterium CG2_30_54_11]|uniref:Large ribosomal subunit protein bL27 n=1 Tax=Candidatus Wirthbacteria bacterium CG2_30_54_11 TaxID=1817892 RepID=A0A1J5J8Q0_9BACT|nr:MAG: 50S ribosomal protein L27 [Candidatus Wirthbacteria bacterium CG2_30_54_11]
MAHIKSGGKTRNGRNSPGQRLGIKKYAGETVSAGEIIVRQCGTKYHPGENMKLAKNDSLYAMMEGVVSFKKKQVKNFNGKLKPRTFVSIDAK